MNWKELYTQKTTTAEEAIKAIRDKDRVVFAHAAGVPQEITLLHIKMISMTWKYTTCYVLVTELIPNRKCYPIFGTTPISWEEIPDKP